jgi:hypothetical protein
MLGLQIFALKKRKYGTNTSRHGNYRLSNKETAAQFQDMTDRG